MSYFMGCIALVRCVLVLSCGLAGVVWYPDTGFSLCRKTNGEVNISHENTTVVVWIYDGI